MEAHMTFIRKQFAEGHFLFSGRKIPRTGGIIIANLKSRKQLDAILKQDPFDQHELADFEITEFLISTTRAELDILKDL